MHRNARSPRHRARRQIACSALIAGSIMSFGTSDVHAQLPLWGRSVASNAPARSTHLPLRRLSDLRDFDWAPGFYVVRTEADWLALWDKRGFSRRGTEPSRPSIDFSTSMVIGIVLGTGPSGCYSVGIRNLDFDPVVPIVNIRYVVSTAQSGEVCPSIVVSMTSFEVVPRLEGEVRFHLVGR